MHYEGENEYVNMLKIHWHRQWTCKEHFSKIVAEVNKKSERPHPSRKTFKQTINELIKKVFKNKYTSRASFRREFIPFRTRTVYLFSRLATRHNGGNWNLNYLIQAWVFSAGRIGLFIDWFIEYIHLTFVLGVKRLLISNLQYAGTMIAQGNLQQR